MSTEERLQQIAETVARIDERTESFGDRLDRFSARHRVLEESQRALRSRMDKVAGGLVVLVLLATLLQPVWAAWVNGD